MRIGLVIAVACTSLCISCDSGKPGSGLRSYSGAPGELIIVAGDYYWNSVVGETIKDVFLAPIPALPQAEPNLTLHQVTEQNFKGIFKNHRNIMKVVIKDFAQEKVSRVDVEKSVWARGQLLITIYADSEQTFLQLFEENGQSILDIINEEERNRGIGKHKKRPAPGAQEALITQFGIESVIPEGFQVIKKDSAFVWIRNDMIRNVGGTSHEIKQNLLVYTETYTDTAMLNEEYISALRDKVTRKHVPGPKKGSYMTTEYLIAPKSRVTQMNGVYAKEVRGLWKLENGFMGGPFISTTSVDTLSNQVITAVGFVFAPKFDKREYLREMESVVYSLKF